MGKTKVILMGSGRATQRFITDNLSSEIIDIVGIIFDGSTDNSEMESFLRKINKERTRIPLLQLTHEALNLGDIVFTPEYRRIVPDEFCEKHLIVNCHGGILPKWRGFAANAWAIMNGEQEIGYSIHRVSPSLDGGLLYFVKHIPIDDEQTYSDVHDSMLDSIAADVPKVLSDIVSGTEKGIDQTGSSFAYCTRFKPAMGVLSTFNNDAQYYVNLFRCMAKPLGTGIRILYKGKLYSVGKVEHGRKYNSIDYLCMPGKVVNIEKGRIWVKVRDNVIVLSDIQLEESIVDPAVVFHNGCILG